MKKIWFVEDRPRAPAGTVILPGIEVPSLRIELSDPHVTEFGRWYLEHPPIMGGAGDIGDAVEAKILDHITNQTSYTMPTPYLGLWTSTLTSASTAATAGELSYT
jgi:hypothetical protein